MPQFGKIENGKIKIPKFKNGIKVKLHREVKGKIGKMAITKPLLEDTMFQSLPSKRLSNYLKPINKLVLI